MPISEQYVVHWQSAVHSRQSTVGSLQSAVVLAMDIYEVSKKFSKDELCFLTTQIRKSSRLCLV